MISGADVIGISRPGAGDSWLWRTGGGAGADMVERKDSGACRNDSEKLFKIITFLLSDRGVLAE